MKGLPAIAILSIAAALVVAGPAAHGQSRGNDGTAKLGQFNPPPPPPPLPPPPGPAATQNGAENPQGPAPTGRRRWRDMVDALLDLIAPRAMAVRRWVDDPLTTGFNNPDLVEPAGAPTSA